MSEKEEKVFAQELSEEELAETAGGLFPVNSGPDPAPKDNCTESDHRDIYGGNGFPNCAASVEEGSLCWSNDACNRSAIIYTGMEDCFANDCNKAWK
ncbi:MAG: hypothetical protein ACSW8A_08050 [Lachnospiraceae bacterium]